MKNTSALLIILVLIVGVGIGYVVGNQGFPPSRSSTSMHMMGNGARMPNNIDQHFITQMIPHHQGAIDMARIALQRSERSEVRTLAQSIVEDQEKENTQMRTWYQSWFGGSVPVDGMGMMHMDSMRGDLTRLQTISSPAFDKEFIAQMIPHHEMAIMMAQMLESTSNRSEMKQLAKNIIEAQTREINLMREWYRQW